MFEGAKHPVDVRLEATGAKCRLWRNFSQVKKVPSRRSDFRQVHNKPVFTKAIQHFLCDYHEENTFILENLHKKTYNNNIL